MAYNWQNWKRVFLSCFCHEIYRVEEICLKESNYNLKIKFFVYMWNLGNLCKNGYSANNCLIKVWIWEFFCTHITHVIADILCTAKFVSTNQFLVTCRFPFPILHFKEQNHLALLKNRFLKKLRLRSKHLSPFLSITNSINNSFNTLI